MTHENIPPLGMHLKLGKTLKKPPATGDFSHGYGVEGVYPQSTHGFYHVFTIVFSPSKKIGFHGVPFSIKP